MVRLESDSVGVAAASFVRYVSRLMPRLSHDVRVRLRDQMQRRGLTQRSVAGLLQWSQSKVAHQLTGRVEMSVDDLAAFCFALNVHVTEIVRDHGLEFCAELTPSELRRLEQIRSLPAAELKALETVLDRLAPTRPAARRTALGAGSAHKTAHQHDRARNRAARS